MTGLEPQALIDAAGPAGVTGSVVGAVHLAKMAGLKKRRAPLLAITLAVGLTGLAGRVEGGGWDWSVLLQASLAGPVAALAAMKMHDTGQARRRQ